MSTTTLPPLAPQQAGALPPTETALPAWPEIKRAQITACRAFLDAQLDRALRSGRVQGEREAAIEAQQFQTLSALERCDWPDFWERYAWTGPERLLALPPAVVRAQSVDLDEEAGRG